MRAAPGQHLTVGALVFLSLIAVACDDALHEVPADLIGVWETDESGYESRFLEIRNDVVRFGTGGGEADSYEVLGAIREELGSGIAYTIVYQDVEFDEARLHLVYDPAARSLRLKNRPQVTWWLQGTERPPAVESRPPRARNVGRVG